MYDKLKSFTHYGQEITHNTLRNCWEQILLSSNYTERKSAVDKFNRYFFLIALIEMYKIY